MTRHAKAGGEFGANGEWYEGGKFINTIAENSKKEGSKPRRVHKCQIEPFVWVVPPREGLRSVFSEFEGVYGCVRNGVAQLRTDDRLPITLAYYNRTLDEVTRLIAEYNAGMRWHDAAGFYPK